MTIVCTVSPRRDYEQFDEDVPFALITCTIQVQDAAGIWLDKHFLDNFLAEYLSSLLEARQAISTAKYEFIPKDASSESIEQQGITYWLGPSPLCTNSYVHSDEHAVGMSSRKPVDKVSVSRSDGVATIQPGLEDAPKARFASKTSIGSDGKYV